MDKEYIERSYAIWNKDNNIRSVSTSGGMVSALSQFIFEQGGVVYTVFENDSKLLFKRTVCDKDIYYAHGSKYYQADTSSIDFDSLILDIKNGYVLIIGTACQIGMFYTVIKSRFGTIPDTLFLVNILCHGVASESIVKKYRLEMEHKYKQKLLIHRFRSKKIGRPSSQYSEYIFSKGKHLIINNDDDYFMRMFFSNVCLRPSCYKCVFAGNNLYSDITIGDFNGASRVVEHFPDTSKVVSAFIIRSPKGELLFNSISDTICFIETNEKVISSQNQPLIKPVKKPKIRKIIYKMYDKLGIIRTSKLISGKYYILKILYNILGKEKLNKLKRFLGKNVIEN